MNANVSQLIEQLKSTDAAAQRAAVAALVTLGPESVPGLIASLSDMDPMARVLASDALGQLGPRARAAIPALRKARTDPYLPVRLRAGKALKRIRWLRTALVRVGATPWPPPATMATSCCGKRTPAPGWLTWNGRRGPRRRSPSPPTARRWPGRIPTTGG